MISGQIRDEIQRMPGLHWRVIAISKYKILIIWTHYYQSKVDRNANIISR